MYPVTVFKWLYDINLRKLQETHPDALPQPDRASRFGSDKTLKKAYLITLLLAVLRDREMARQFFETLPTMTREAIAAVTWEPRANLATLEKTLGCQLVPPPPGFELLPLDSVPDAAHSRYSCEQKAMADLRLVAEYIAQGHLKYTKSEQVAMPSLKILRQMTGGPEFFDAPADSDLALLRTRLLVGGTAFAGEKERENMRTYHALRETVPSLFGQSTGGLVANATLVEDTWSRAVHVDGHNEFKLIGEPLLKGYAFLLAAFGLVEIAYVSPTHDTYRRPKKDYLTPYDGLRFARLTPLGEYVFHQRKTYEVAGGPPTRSRIVLDEVRLLATCGFLRTARDLGAVLRANHGPHCAAESRAGIYRAEGQRRRGNQAPLRVRPSPAGDCAQGGGTADCRPPKRPQEARQAPGTFRLSEPHPARDMMLNHPDGSYRRQTLLQTDSSLWTVREAMTASPPCALITRCGLYYNLLCRARWRRHSSTAQLF